MDRNKKRTKYENTLPGDYLRYAGGHAVSYYGNGVVHLSLLFVLVAALELVNTAVEAVVDLVTEEKKPLAKIAKDTAAGAVLFAAIVSVIIGCIIFLPYLLELFSKM